MSDREFPFAVFWVSPRGFANEGAWVYGPIASLREYVKPYRGDVNAKFYRESWHQTQKAARKAAVDLARRDRRQAPNHELCAVTACAVDDETGEGDRDVVAYGWSVER